MSLNPPDVQIPTDLEVPADQIPSAVTNEAPSPVPAE